MAIVAEARTVTTTAAMISSRVFRFCLFVFLFLCLVEAVVRQGSGEVEGGELEEGRCRDDARVARLVQACYVSLPVFVFLGHAEKRVK
jgi:hypothetical protein